MFNTSYYRGGDVTNNNTVKINAVTGAILKNHPKSWFERFHLTSNRAKALFKEGGHEAFKEVWKKWDFVSSGPDGRYVQERDADKDITILQMVICGDMEVMAELVYTKDYVNVIDDRDARIRELEKELEKAYQVIGEVVDKPNPFTKE